MLGCYMLMMYYTTVTGWMLSYFGKFLTGVFRAGMGTEEVGGVFGTLLASPGEMAIWTELVVILGFAVCSFGLQKGLERISKYMMLALLALILVLAVHSLTLPGAGEGMRFYLLPSIESIRENGFGKMITDAMNQAFFTLSLGIAAMEIFGSYMSDKHTLGGEAVLDSEDFIVSNLLLPCGSLVYLLFCVSKWGWGFDRYIAEVNKGEGLKLSPKLKPYFRYVLPVLILIILIQGLI